MAPVSEPKVLRLTIQICQLFFQLQDAQDQLYDTRMFKIVGYEWCNIMLDHINVLWMRYKDI